MSVSSFRCTALVWCILLCASVSALSQRFDWIRHAALQYNLNPQMPKSALAYDSFDGKEHILTARLDSSVIIFGDVYGRYSLECRTPKGEILWSLLLGSKVFVSNICTDAKGNTLLAGKFLENLRIGTQDSLTNTSTANLSDNSFLLCFDAQGALLWKRNCSQNMELGAKITAVACDANHRFWYAVCDFSKSSLIQLDAQGKDLLRLEQGGVKILSSFCFDAANNIYLCGATGSGEPFTMGSLHRTVTEVYAMFLARYTFQAATYQGEWVHFVHDITFSAPQVATDPIGDVFFAGMLFDSARIGNLRITKSSFLQSVFVAKVDRSGIPLWIRQTPNVSSTPKGTIESASQNFITSLPNGGVALGGTARGELDWGNGVITSTGGLTDHRCAIVLFDSDGKAQWTLWGGTTATNYLHNLVAAPSGDMYFSAAVQGNGSFGTLPVTAPTFSILTGKIALPFSTSAPDDLPTPISVYPNPSTQGIITIPERFYGSAVSVYTTLGELVFHQPLLSTPFLDLSAVPTGAYRIQFLQGEVRSSSSWIRY